MEIRKIYNPAIEWDKKPTEQELKIINKVIKGIALAEMETSGIKLHEGAEIEEFEPQVVPNIYNIGFRVLTRVDIILDVEEDRNDKIISVPLQKRG